MGNNGTSSSGDPDHHFVPASPPKNGDYRHARWSGFNGFPNPRPAPAEGSDNDTTYTPRIIVVGVCSSGKSTLVRKLKEVGYDAHACSQEHSYVPHLWQLSNPDILVYLDASLHTIRRRRKAKWQQSVLDEEHRRLSHARTHSDLYISTDGIAPEDVASKAISFLKMHAKKGAINQVIEQQPAEDR